MNAIELSNVSLSSSQKEILKDVNLQVPEGTIAGLFGPKGSGKTALSELLVDIQVPDRGTVSVLGGPPNKLDKNRIGYLPRGLGLFKGMEDRERLRFYYLLENRTSYERARKLKVRFNLQRKEKTTTTELRKLAFLCAVAHEPRLAILDEPTQGLGPKDAEVVIAQIERIAKRGSTVLLSSEDPLLIERVCDAVFFLNEGRALLEGATPIEELRSRYPDEGFEIETAVDEERLRAVEGVVRVLPLDDESYFVQAEKSAAPEGLYGRLCALGPVPRFAAKRMALTDIFATLTCQDPG